MISRFAFTRIPEIIFGAGTFTELPSLIASKGRTVLLVTGSSSFRRSSHYAYLMKELGSRSVTVYESSVITEPSAPLVDMVAANYRAKGIDVVAGIGGGSVMDAAKAISAMLTVNDSVKEYIEGIGSRKHPGTKKFLIAVPTTAGTGSEATKNAVLSEIGEKGYKKSLRHDNFVPDVALIDPELTLSLPPEVTAATALDAITQLIEAYTATSANPLTDALAISGIEHMSSSLLRAYRHPDDIEARTGLAYGALMSGICLAQSGLGIVHGFASSIGGLFEIPHGVLCGTLLAACLRKNINLLIQQKEYAFLEKYARISNVLGQEKYKTVEDRARHLPEIIDQWLTEMKIPRLSAYNIRQEDIVRIVNLTENKSNPVRLTHSDMADILRERL